MRDLEADSEYSIIYNRLKINKETIQDNNIPKKVAKEEIGTDGQCWALGINLVTPQPPESEKEQKKRQKK